MKKFFQRNTTREIGQQAEDSAAEFLQKQGLTILHKNFRSKYGEIDLIADHQGDIVFVEVKFRKNNHYGNPFEVVDQKKQKKIIYTAQYYLQRNSRDANKPCRFDVISIHADKIDWIENAFDADLI